jgi:hypothetical protein
MKAKLIRIIFAALMAAWPIANASASNVDFGINVNIGNPPPPPPPVQIVIEEPPQFIYPSSLGFYVAIGIPYDMFYISNRYYIYRGDRWYFAPTYNGPWRVISYQRIPAPLRSHRIELIRERRDAEFRVYSRDRDHYRGRYYRPESVRRGGHEVREGREGRGEGRGREERREDRGRGRD